MPNYDPERVRSLLAADKYASTLGVELVSVDEESIVIALEVREDHLNFLELGHGGMVFSLADVLFSLASNSQGATALAIDAHIALMSATRLGNRLTATVTELSRGRRLATYGVEVRRGDGRIVGAFTGTVHITAD